MPPSAALTFASIGRLHIVAIAALGTFTFGWLFTDEYPWLLAGVTALDWYLVNLLNRVVDLPEDRINQIRGVDFVAKNRRAIVIAGFATLILSLIAIAFVVPRITPLRVAYHLLGLTYNWPLFGGKRIKQLYFWKNTASATGFMLTVFGYPLAASADLSFPTGITVWTVLVTALFFFPFELSYEVIYDLRDAEGDRAAAVQTYAVVHGEVGAVRVADGLIAAAVAALVVGYATHVVPWRIFIMIFAPALQLVLYKRWLRRGITAKDCINLTWIGAALLATYHVWVVLKLPGV